MLGAWTLAACGGGSAPQSSGSTLRWCRPSANPTYPGQRSGDCVGYARYRFIVQVDGYEVLMGNWKRYTDDQGHRLICAGVNVEDVASDAQHLSAGQFMLRDPSGATARGTPAPSNGLPARLLPHGVQQGGGVCWPDSGRGGPYVGSFEPGGPERGVWLVSFLQAR